MVFDAFAHRAGVLDEVLVPGGVPHHGPEGVEVGPPQFEVAGDGPGLQERLELPPLRPPFVVRHMRVERAHERAVLALGAQACVEHPQGRLVGGGGDGAADRGGQLRRDGQHGLVVRAFVGQRPGDVDDVDVGDVVELARARLAHGHDRQADVLGPGDADSRDRQRRLQGPADGVGDRGGHARHRRQGVGTGQIRGGDREDPLEVVGAHGVDGVVPSAGGHGDVVVGVGPHRRQSRAAFARQRDVLEAFAPFEHVQGPGVGDDEVPKDAGHPEHGEQAAPPGAPQAGFQTGRIGAGFGEPDERQQALVGVGDGGEVLRVEPAELGGGGLGEQPGRAQGIGEAGLAQAARRRLFPHRSSLSKSAGSAFARPG